MVKRPTDMPLDPRLEQAADWHARLQGDGDQASWLAFAQWLEADSANRAAYDQVESLWRQLDRLPATEPVIDLASRRPAASLPTPANLSRRWFLGGGAAAAAAVALTIGNRFVAGPAAQMFETAHGQRRTVQLADGSSITMSSDTRLTVAMADGSRAVVLERGEALFDVAKDPNRPFTVAADGRLVTVVGTAFNVRNLDQSVTVTVTRGLVDVGNADGSGKVRLTPGQQIGARRGQALGGVSNVDAAVVTLWTQGRLSFDNAPLPQVLAELSRHYPAAMLTDRNAASLHFSGVLQLGKDQATVLATLQGLLPVAVARQGDSFVLSTHP